MVSFDKTDNVEWLVGCIEQMENVDHRELTPRSQRSPFAFDRGLKVRVSAVSKGKRPCA
jgi:hypothetical protein